MKHTCHALGCDNVCPPAWLMCRKCWGQVPADIQTEVYRTVKRRGPDVDSTWAPWWRAQARAIHHVAMERDRLGGIPPDPRGLMYLERELAFADTLASKK